MPPKKKVRSSSPTVKPTKVKKKPTPSHNSSSIEDDDDRIRHVPRIISEKWRGLKCLPHVLVVVQTKCDRGLKTVRVIAP